jgi:VWFA-related protein
VRIASWSLALGLTAGVVLLAAGPRAQTPQGRRAATFRAGVEGVRVDVLVKNHELSVRDLRDEDFTLLDNGVPQHVRVLGFRERVNVVLVLDVSGSMNGKPLTDLVAAARSLLNVLHDDDGVALVTFSERIDVVTERGEASAPVRARLNEVRAGGMSALFDATFAGLMLTERDPDPSLVLLFSDGADNASWLDDEAVLDTARRSEVVVYGVGRERRHVQRRDDTAMRMGPNPVVVGTAPSLALELEPDDPARFAQALADATGGGVLRVERFDQLRRAFFNVVSEYRSRYLLTYEPTGVGRDDGWHTLEVVLRGKAGTVKARPGYMAGK